MAQAGAEGKQRLLQTNKWYKPRDPQPILTGKWPENFKHKSRKRRVLLEYSKNIKGKSLVTTHGAYNN